MTITPKICVCVWKIKLGAISKSRRQEIGSE